MKTRRIAEVAALVRRRLAGQRGAATAEYALVLLVAATMALLLLNWVRGGAVTQFFQSLFDRVVQMFA